MTTLRHLVRGATLPGKSASWVINDLQPADVAARRKSMPGGVRSVGSKHV